MVIPRGDGLDFQSKAEHGLACLHQQRFAQRWHQQASPLQPHTAHAQRERQGLCLKTCENGIGRQGVARFVDFRLQKPDGNLDLLFEAEVSHTSLVPGVSILGHIGQRHGKLRHGDVQIGDALDLVGTLQGEGLTCSAQAGGLHCDELTGDHAQERRHQVEE